MLRNLSPTTDTLLSVATEIIVAAISAGVGLATGALGSLVAPWANWGVEKRRLCRASRVERIQEWRSGVAALRSAESEDGKPKQVPKRTPLTASLGDRTTERPQYVTVVPDSDLVNVQTKRWFRQLQRELSMKTRRRIENLTAQPLQQRLGALPDLLDEEINRIERNNWKLI